MARVRNRTGEDRYVPSLRRVIPDDGVMDVPDDRAEAWSAQPGWDVETEASPAAGRRRRNQNAEE